MERPVSFSAEDIRDEKVCCATKVIERCSHTCGIGQGVALDPSHQV